MQSGISASQELVAAFNDLLSAPSNFGLLVTIAGEALKPVTTLPSSSPDFAANVTQLAPHLRSDEALYALLRRYDSAPAFVAVTYVPDAAKVRQKMLFASTRLTLVRELGSEHFRDTIFATTTDELSPAGFDRHDRHAELDAPLTEEERTLGDVKRAEAAAGAGTGSRQIHLSQHMKMPIATDALAALSEMGRGEGGGLVMLKIDADTETVALVPRPTASSQPPATVAEAVAEISTEEPRFTFFRHRASRDGVDRDVVLFVYTNPPTGGRTKAIKSRMLYPLQKRAVLTLAEAEAGVKADAKFEVEEPAEVTDEAVSAELFPQAVAKPAFKRPKRPGR
ncbi:hypothetical protein GGR56DRAFT_297428 [Xylariaceae sp. FL0804]|nr:hypothetical protein GGR56DRAFT_297428 [Xylariaceae sp. FL0804]